MRGGSDKDREARPATGKSGGPKARPGGKSAQARKADAAAVQQAKSAMGQPRTKSSRSSKTPVRLHPAKAVQAAANGTQPPAKKRRKGRSPIFPLPPADREIDYAKCRAGVKKMRPGHVVLAVLTTHAWLKVMQPLLDAIEERRRAASPNSKRRRGQQSQWTALEFEMIELLRRVLGLRSCKETLAWLSSPQARLTRRILGLDRPRLVKGGRSLALDLVGLRGWRGSAHSPRRLILPPLTSSSTGPLKRAPAVSLRGILTHKSLANLSL